MSKQPFKKGDKVYQLKNWDQKGTFCIYTRIVKSCGAKQMTCYEEDDARMAREFVYANQYEHLLDASTTTMEEAEKVAIDRACDYIASTYAGYHAQIARQIEAGNSDREDWARQMLKGFEAEVHPPKAITLKAFYQELRSRP